MLRNGGLLAGVAFWLILTTVSDSSAQIRLPTRQHDTLDFQLKSLRDDITLYMGDPQELLLMYVRPPLTTQPRVTYSGQANAVLEILDRELIEARGAREPAAEGGDEHAPYGQKWDVRVCPSGPTSFSIKCEQGTSSFDFTGFEVQKVNLWADGSNLEVGFEDPNPIPLESCNITAKGGSLHFSGLVNARAKEITVFAPQSDCEIEVTGKSFEGASAITLQGPPAFLQIALSRKIGVRIDGPRATTSRFAASHMVQDGDSWVSRDYAKAKCRILLTIAEEIPRLEVNWR
jgi:hypothetical protein